MALIPWLLAAAVSANTPQPRTASLLWITLDTTRDDSVGASRTPNLEALARAGTRYARALTVAPLTLPAHCSLMTGLTPPEHGVRDNGIGSLPRDIPTLAEALAARGYVTAAFVSSRVLDHRFGLDRGFATYDDRMVAERIGEQGYPERDARAVTTAALAWAAALPPGRPFFLWVHYYDPHAPYEPPGDWRGQSAPRRYAGEIAYVDSEIGRLLRGLPESPGGRLVAAVGDHGEMLGEHGEPEHGVLLYSASLSVPLILAGPSVPAGVVVPDVVGTRGLAATVLSLLGLSSDARRFGAPLPGVGIAEAGAAAAVYSETFLPANTYGWSSLRCVTDGRWRFVEAPRPELYDLAADPTESDNLVSRRPEEAERLRRELSRFESREPPAPSPRPDPELAASLRSLGYLSGASPSRACGLDPKDGIELLKRFRAGQTLDTRRQGSGGRVGAREPRTPEPRQRPVSDAPRRGPTRGRNARRRPSVTRLRSIPLPRTGFPPRPPRAGLRRARPGARGPKGI